MSDPIDMIESETVGAEAILLAEFKATARRLKTAEEEFRAAQIAHAESIKKLSQEAAK